MRLAFVSDFPDSPDLIVGGVAGVVVSLSQTLHRLYGVEVHVISVTYAGSDSQVNWNGIKIHRIKGSRCPGFLYYWTGLREKIHARLRDIGPDVVHFHGLAGLTLGYSGPYVLTIHGINEKDILHKGGPFVRFRSELVRRVEIIGRRRAKYTIIINPYVLEQLHGQITGKTWIVENPVSELFFEIDRQVVDPNVLFVGAIIPRKNVLGLLAGFRKVVENGTAPTLRVVGPPADLKYFELCRAYVQGHGLENIVTFLGPLPTRAVVDEFSRASCLALVSQQETAPVAVSEALAAGVPVVASRVCGLPYMVEEGSTGYLVTPDVEDEIAARIADLLRDQEANTAMGKRCRSVALERFHARKVAERTVAVYEHILERQ
jgi:glycosyltransferase involved in cell wall biosynthesis